MTLSYTVYGLRTAIIRPGENISESLVNSACQNLPGGFTDGDVVVIAESAVATSEGSLVVLEKVDPSPRAHDLGTHFGVDPRLAELIIQESEEIIGGIQGFLLTMKRGTLLPNAGIDASNAPPGMVVLLPADPDESAARIRTDIRDMTGADVAVIIADSRTHAMRRGCGGVAIGCCGVPSVIDDRGRVDLFGKPLHVTMRALADNLASAAEVVMGEADESIPAAVIRGLEMDLGNYRGVEEIHADECLFMGIKRQYRGDSR